MVNKKLVNFRIKPYVQESMLQVVLDIIILLMLLTVSIAANFPLTVCIIAITGYIGISVFLHYRTVIQATIDKIKGDYVSEIVSVNKIKITEEYSFSGDRLGHSYIRCFYSKNMDVQKYKIKTCNNYDEKVTLRSVMSHQRCRNFGILSEKQVEYIRVTYLKRSKILINVDSVEAFDKKTNRRKINIVEDALRGINYNF